MFKTSNRRTQNPHSSPMGEYCILLYIMDHDGPWMLKLDGASTKDEVTLGGLECSYQQIGLLKSKAALSPTVRVLDVPSDVAQYNKSRGTTKHALCGDIAMTLSLTASYPSRSDVVIAWMLFFSMTHLKKAFKMPRLSQWTSLNCQTQHPPVARSRTCAVSPCPRTWRLKAGGCSSLVRQPSNWSHWLFH